MVTLASENGLSKQELDKLQNNFQADLGKKISASEYHSPDNFFLMFENSSTAEKAMKLIEEYRQADSRLARLTNFKNDPNRTEGIELDFDKTEKATKDNLIAFFKEHGLDVKTNDGPYETHPESN
jgi:hypothetical protein